MGSRSLPLTCAALASFATLVILVTLHGCGPSELPAFANPPPADAATHDDDDDDAGAEGPAERHADAGTNEPARDG